jgi:hypothetical protein
LRQPIEYHFGLRRLVELVLDIVEANDPFAFGDIERTVAKGDPVGRGEALGDVLDFAVVAAIDDGQHLVVQGVTDEHSALGA